MVKSQPSLRPAPIVEALQPVPGELGIFLRDYFVDGRIAIAPPQNNVLIVEGVTSVVLYRAGQFQVELVIVQPGVTIPPHCHDDVDSFEVAMSGGIDLVVDDVKVARIRPPSRETNMMRDFARFVPIACTAMHGGKAGPEGACFLSVQRWRDGVLPSHVGLNWRGATMGSQHSQIAGHA